MKSISKRQVPFNKLQIGCGRQAKAEYWNIDRLLLPGVDEVVDCEKPLPFADNQFEEVYARASVEHIKNFWGLFSELHRITKPDGIIKILVPHPSGIFTFRDPTHSVFYTLHTLDYFVAGSPFDFYTKTRFKILKRDLFVTTGRLRFLNIFSWVINRHTLLQDIWERFCWIFPMDGIWFYLKPVKPLVDNSVDNSRS